MKMALAVVKASGALDSPKRDRLRGRPQLGVLALWPIALQSPPTTFILLCVTAQFNSARAGGVYVPDQQWEHEWILRHIASYCPWDLPSVPCIYQWYSVQPSFPHQQKL